MSSDLEQVVLNGVAFNDQVTFSMEELVFTPAPKKANLAESPNADGSVLVEEPKYGSAFFDASIRVVPAEDMDAALAALGTLMDALQGCERNADGSPVEWTPAEATTTYTAYAFLGELLELPITVTGDLAGWFINSPIVKVKLSCRSFLYTDERVVLKATESTDSLQVAYVGGILGHVPAEGRMVLTDAATQQRRSAEWGRDVVESAVGNPDLTFKADEDLTVTGFAGELTKQTGSLSTEVIKATLVEKPVTICSTGDIPHVGSYRLSVRAQATVVGASLRLAYRVGDGPLKRLPWAEVTQSGRWFELDLREAFLEEVEKGTQVSEVLIEGKSDEGGTVYVDVLDSIPTRGYGVARAPLALATPAAFKAFSAFATEVGAITGDSLLVGGTWQGAGDADDFSVASDADGNTVARRTSVEDGSPGRLLGPSGVMNLTDTAAEVEIALGGIHNGFQFGLALRYVNLENFAALAVIFNDTNSITISFNKWVGGVSKSTSVIRRFGPVAERRYKLSAIALKSGVYALWIDDQLVLLGQDSDLATGGALASGQPRLYDNATTKLAITTRDYYNFTVWVPEIGVVCNSGQSLEVRSEDVEREDSGGTYWSPVPMYRGGGFHLDPAGEEELVNRLAVKLRRGDIKAEPDSSNGAKDKQVLEVLARERFLVPR